MPLYRLPGIVLRTHPFSDTHLIVTLLSPTRGRIRSIAKGSRRIQSALGHCVQPMVYAHYQLAEGKNLDVITQGVIQNAFPAIRSNLERLSYALYALELVERLVEEPEPQHELFFLLLKTLEGLEEGKAPQALLRVFEAHLLRLLGFAPHLKNCVLCKNQEKVEKFSVRLGGVLCILCLDKDKQAFPVSLGVLEGMERISNFPPGEAPEIALEFLFRIAVIHQRFLEERCGKVFHGLHFIEKVRLLEK